MPGKATQRPFQRADTLFSKDGLTVTVRLRVDRLKYEFARHWAEHHDAEPERTAEVILEGYLNMALLTHIDELDWKAPPEIEALYPKPKVRPPEPDDDGLPF